jgi:hypothetical protein
VDVRVLGLDLDLDLDQLGRFGSIHLLSPKEHGAPVSTLNSLSLTFGLATTSSFLNSLAATRCENPSDSPTNQSSFFFLPVRFSGSIAVECI